MKNLPKTTVSNINLFEGIDKNKLISTDIKINSLDIEAKIIRTTKKDTLEYYFLNVKKHFSTLNDGLKVIKSKKNITDKKLLKKELLDNFEIKNINSSLLNLFAILCDYKFSKLEVSFNSNISLETLQFIITNYYKMVDLKDFISNENITIKGYTNYINSLKAFDIKELRKSLKVYTKELSNAKKRYDIHILNNETTEEKSTKENKKVA